MEDHKLRFEFMSYKSKVTLMVLFSSTKVGYQVGIVSFGPGGPCGSKYPGVYTRISHYNQWIGKVVDRHLKI